MAFSAFGPTSPPGPTRQANLAYLLILCQVFLEEQHIKKSAQSYFIWLRNPISICDNIQTDDRKMTHRQTSPMYKNSGVRILPTPQK